METIGRRWTKGAAVALAAYGAACRSDGRFARLALDRLSVPAMAALHRLTAPIPFPVAEPAALALAAALAWTLTSALCRAAAKRSPLPLRRWLSGLGAAALLLGGGLALLWAPARAIPAVTLPSPETGALIQLCQSLIDDLNASPLAFPDPAQTLARAPEVAGLAGCAVKAARYPEWMRSCQAAGLFVPLTGEALVDASAPASLLPFTAVHELMHLAGVADEGAANIAAWRRCVAADEPFANSARLWALRYALGLLRQRDRASWRQARTKMEGALERAFLDCGGELPPARQAPGLRVGDYAALVSCLAERGG